ncbi:hypothetical protein Y1Q_0004009 [Alligator mississippiensis]|uniref:Uncharacterized protein n=1 Tax=Alligator mississippiensis TaxID=8496 RepID=A0A151PHT9_ALLMI|nr:hypothetical protein Y1Q_0004009 [Alligator mississippiensis]
MFRENNSYLSASQCNQEAVKPGQVSHCLFTATRLPKQDLFGEPVIQESQNVAKASFPAHLYQRGFTSPEAASFFADP